MYSGIIEGFYGQPYSTEERNLILKNLAEFQNPCYVYAPKDDPFHRIRWRESYPDENWENLISNIKNATAYGVDFFYGLSPLGFSEPGRDAVRGAEKIRKALETGAAGAAVLFDDIEVEPDEELADAQSEFIRILLDKTPCRLLLCPTIYCEAQVNNSSAVKYLNRLNEKVPVDVKFFWTGEDVVSETVTRITIEKAENLLNRKPLIWDNYFADDYCLRRIYMGELGSRIPENCTGYLLNPSSISCISLWNIYEMKCVSGIKTDPPPELIPDNPGWHWLKEFHRGPWSCGVDCINLFEHLERSLENKTSAETEVLLHTMINDLNILSEVLPVIPGGYRLNPYLNDLKRFLSIWLNVTESPLNMRHSVLDYLLLQRLPYEHILAEFTRNAVKKSVKKNPESGGE